MTKAIDQIFIPGCNKCFNIDEALFEDASLDKHASNGQITH